MVNCRLRSNFSSKILERDYPNLKGVDIRNLSDDDLTLRYGVAPHLIPNLKAATKQYTDSLAEPLHRIIKVPAVYVLQYPKLAAIDDMRTVSLSQLAEIIGGNPKKALEIAQRMKKSLYRQIRKRGLNLSPVDRWEEEILGVVNNPDRKKELSGLFPVDASKLGSIEAYVKAQPEGKIKSIYELLNAEGIGEEAINSALARADSSKTIDLQKIMTTRDRPIAEAYLAEGVLGFGKKRASQIYNALKSFVL